MSTEQIDVARYDRQIRLWGLNTQQGLKGAKILLLGANGLANEIAKNLVLAGVGHLRIQDPDIILPADLASGGLFSVAQPQLGCSKAGMLAEQLKPMNPSVELTSTQAGVSELLDAPTLARYDFIIGTRGVGAVRELGEITALLERRRGGENSDPQSEPPSAKRARTTAPAAEQPASGTVAVPKSNGAHEVLPMRAAHGSEGAHPKLLACGTIGVDGFCFFDLGAPIVTIHPPTKGEEDDEGAAKKKESKQPPALPVTEQAFYPSIASAASIEFAPTAAIVGGLVASEVIKIIDGTWRPVNNALFVDGTTSDGLVQRLGPAFERASGSVDTGAFKPLKA